MMRQIFRIIPGGKTFALKNGGYATCAVSYQGAVVMMGGSGYPYHGKVDRWEVNNNILFPISLSDTTRKATTSTLYPTFLRQDVITPAPRSHLQMERRFDSKVCTVSLYFPRACWSPEVTMITLDFSQARSCTCRQRSSGPEEEIFPGISSKSYQ